MRFNSNFNEDSDERYASSFIEEPDIEEIDEVIEDEPEPINAMRFVRLFFKQWKILVVLMAVCGLGWGILHPGTSSTTYGAKCTVYIPSYTSKTVNGKQVVQTNNLSQVKNALGLIQSKVYRDNIAQELGTDNVGSYGSYSVSQRPDTELITINVSSRSTDDAKKLCQAVFDVFSKQIGKQLSINDMLLVDPISPYSNITATSTITSIIKGAFGGVVLYGLYSLYLFFSDRRLHSKEEVEEYLQVPVLCILPDEDHKQIEDAKKRNKIYEKLKLNQIENVLKNSTSFLKK